MQILYNKNLVDTADFMVQTIGFFDGVHRGHQYLLHQVRQLAEQRKLKSMVITFRNHPQTVLQPNKTIPLLTTLEEKLQLIERCGIDYVALLDFTPQLAQQTAQQYMKNVLIGQLRGKCLLVGYDHHFGQKNGDGFEQYQYYGAQLGLDVVLAQELAPWSQKTQDSTQSFAMPAQIHASSTSVREALANGNVAMARQILGRTYSFSGIVKHGEAIGRTIGFPTANIKPDNSNKIIPANGVYAVKATLDGHSLNGMLYIGNRPTLENLNEPRIEVHFADFNEEIYDKHLEIEFVDFLRGEEKFSSVDELKKQLACDLQRARQIISSDNE